MAGTIVKLVGQGHDLLLLDVTSGEPTPHGTPQIRAREAQEAAGILGVPRRQLGLVNRQVEHTVEARHLVAGVIREHRSQIVFLPYPEDAHPDHRATTRIVEDARFDAKLTKIDLPGDPIYPKWMIYYYCMHLRSSIVPTFCIDITQQMDVKERAILAYESQFITPPRNRKVVDWLRQMNGYMGSRIGTDYAEPFYSREPLGLSGFESLVMGA